MHWWWGVGGLVGAPRQQEGWSSTKIAVAAAAPAQDMTIVCYDSNHNYYVKLGIFWAIVYPLGARLVWNHPLASLLPASWQSPAASCAK